MKKLLFILMSFSLIACGSGDETEPTENSNYFIKVGSEGQEAGSSNDINYFSDNIAEETQFDIHGAILKVYGMTGDFKEDPKSVEGKSYEGEVTIDEMKSCKVTFTKVSEAGKDDMKTDYDLEGTIQVGGEEGKFRVSMFKMNH
ncbi:MAG: hypothetical protein H6598_03545 [Flavobacteriales bacterium]|nr:hypothetical protein [Flavobacteriales bacterium]